MVKDIFKTVIYTQMWFTERLPFLNRGSPNGIPPSAAMRPLQIIHGGVVRYNTPEKMAYFKDQDGNKLEMLIKMDVPGLYMYVKIRNIPHEKNNFV